jgi:hypothetical protein
MYQSISLDFVFTFGGRCGMVDEERTKRSIDGVGGQTFERM